MQGAGCGDEKAGWQESIGAVKSRKGRTLGKVKGEVVEKKGKTIVKNKKKKDNRNMHSVRIYPTFRDATTSFWGETSGSVEKCRLFSQCFLWLPRNKVLTRRRKWIYRKNLRLLLVNLSR